MGECLGEAKEQLDKPALSLFLGIVRDLPNVDAAARSGAELPSHFVDRVHNLFASVIDTIFSIVPRSCQCLVFELKCSQQLSLIFVEVWRINGNCPLTVFKDMFAFGMQLTSYLNKCIGIAKLIFHHG